MTDTVTQAETLEAGAGEAEAGTPIPNGAQPFGRRLTDKLLAAFSQACDQHALDVAEEILGVIEMALAVHLPIGEVERRRQMECLVAAYERLWLLRQRPRCAA
jgi:hypothetical protein